MRVLIPMFKMGLFDRPYMPLNSTANNITSAEHNVVARKLRGRPWCCCKTAARSCRWTCTS